MNDIACIYKLWSCPCAALTLLLLDYQCTCQLSLGTRVSQCSNGQSSKVSEWWRNTSSFSVPPSSRVKVAILVSMVTVALATLYPGTVGLERGRRAKLSSGSIFRFRLLNRLVHISELESDKWKKQSQRNLLPQCAFSPSGTLQWTKNVC
jgi:hypothetical protein